MKKLDRNSEIDEERLLQILSPGTGDFEVASPSISPTHYFWVVFRQKWKILGFMAIVGLAAYLYSSRLTPVYEATAIIDVDRELPTLPIGQEAAQVQAAEDSDAFLATQAELIQSDSVVRPVVERFDLLRKENDLDKKPTDPHRPPDAPVYLRYLAVFRDPNTDILRIVYRSSDPELAARVANAVAESYLRHSYEIRIHSSVAMSSFMEKQLDELRAKMERSSLALAKFEQELNVVNPEERTNILSARLLQLNTDYTAAQADRVQKQAAYEAMKNGSVAAAQVSSQGAQLTALYDRVNQAKQHLADIATIYGPAHAEYRKAANDLAELQRQFDEMRRNVIQRVQTDYQEASARETMLGQKVAETKSEWDQLNTRSFQYEQLKREADADRALYSDLERRIREAGINSGFQNSSIRIADPARPPLGPILPRVGRNVTFACLISLVLGICAAIAADLLDNTVRDPEQAARALDVSVLGALPRVKDMRRLPAPLAQGEDPAMTDRRITPVPATAEKQPRWPAWGHRRPQPAQGLAGIVSYEEAIRTLRHSILLPDLDRSIRSLLLTSAAPGDGKSTAIIHLALAHAEQGKRTLVIDADLRRPGIGKKLDIKTTVGLSNVLLGELKWQDAILTSDYRPELDILPAGAVSRRASDLVGAMMVEILEEASKEYDLIFVDAPPLLGFAEAMQIATAVDAVVVLARAGKTSRRAIATVLATLKRLRSHIVGLVLNEVDKNTSQDYYYYYSDYRKYYAEARS